jgi:hypothetical protein
MSGSRYCSEIQTACLVLKEHVVFQWHLQSSRSPDPMVYSPCLAETAEVAICHATHISPARVIPSSPDGNGNDSETVSLVEDGDGIPSFTPLIVSQRSKSSLHMCPPSPELLVLCDEAKSKNIQQASSPASVTAICDDPMCVMRSAFLVSHTITNNLDREA